MTARQLVADASRPSLPKHLKLRFDKTREQWIVLAPERVLVLDQTSHEVLKRCDGTTSVAAIVADLATAFDAPPEVIGADVAALLQDMADKGYLQL
jgi:pyrroloquinoline quinone biosynthesis protein D